MTTPQSKGKQDPESGSPVITTHAVKLQRPIRFVTDNEEPQSKRRRISAACKTCQRRKTKCSGEKPACKTCIDSENECLGYAEPNSNSARLSVSLHQRAQRGKRSISPVSTVKERRDADSSALHPSKANQLDTGEIPAKTRSGSSSQKLKDVALDSGVDASTGYGNCVPFFRYFGPTAIVPGFKAMVVELNPADEATSTDPNLSTGDLNVVPGASPELSRHSTTPDPPGVPVYNKKDQGPIDVLIVNLCETFFDHLGCNYPFLLRSAFLADLRDRKADPVLVDAICAIAARFSKDPALALASRYCDESSTFFNRVHKSKYGHVFARRAMSSITKIFACPNLAAVQACLLLAYEQFGSDRDSGLWVYLGLSIRMAQDLGLQKLEGLKYEGYLGPTPKTAKMGAAGRLEEQAGEQKFKVMREAWGPDDELAQEQRQAERERINTFWAVFFLDRVVSSGTGRPVSLRDKDIEISFPPDDQILSSTEWPLPFPALIRIIHLYGRVANLLNNIREANQVNQATLKQLIAAEDDLIAIYQRLSPNLHFSAANFQYYLKHSQATNFVLLHFWFHTLIVLLHQPTLLHSFEGRIQQLFPNSLELSLSSAKTIADMLSFAELLDSKSFIGNPFTSQPIYIAACAFLLESATHSLSRSQSREATPPNSPHHALRAPGQLYTEINKASQNGVNTGRNTSAPSKRLRPADKKDLSKQSLLATAATHNYQRCYNSLKALESYWAGTRYIVNVLDQKSKGSLDPLLYAVEDLGDAYQVDGLQTLCKFPTRGQRRALGASTSAGASADHNAHLSRLKSSMDSRREGKCANGKSTSQAIGWSLTGSTDSVDSNLSFLYQPPSHGVGSPSNITTGPALSAFEGLTSGYVKPITDTTDIRIKDQPASPGASPRVGPKDGARYVVVPAPSLALNDESGQGQDHTSQAESATNNGTPTNGHMNLLSSPAMATAGISVPSTAPVAITQPTPSASGSTAAHPLSSSLFAANVAAATVSDSNQGPPLLQGHAGPHAAYGDVIIESQNVDMSTLGIDPMLWLDYMPHGFLDAFEPALQGPPSERPPE